MKALFGIMPFLLLFNLLVRCMYQFLS